MITMHSEMLDGDAPPPSSRRETPLRVLLAEDDNPTRLELAAALKARGFDVIEVSSGLALLYQAFMGWKDVFDKPDLILTEGSLDGWSGYEMKELLRGAGVTTPFAFLTRPVHPDEVAQLFAEEPLG